MGGNFFLVVVLIFFVILYCFFVSKTDGAPDRKYDERQLVVRGKAFEYAFYALLIYFMGISILSSITDREYIVLGAYAYVGMCLGLLVFASYNVFHDAYLGVKDNVNVNIGLCLAIGVWKILFGLPDIHTVFVEGVIQKEICSYAYGFTFLYIGIIMLVKTLMNRKEA